MSDQGGDIVPIDKNKKAADEPPSRDVAECRWLHKWEVKVKDESGIITRAVPDKCPTCGNDWNRIYRNVDRWQHRGV